MNGQVEFKGEEPNDGGPAFPTLPEHGFNTGEPGMTLRDYFASKVDLTPYAPLKLFRTIRGTEPTVEELAECIAAIRFTEADAMVKARSE